MLNLKINKDTKFIHKNLVFTLDKYIIYRSLQDVVWQIYTSGKYFENSETLKHLAKNRYLVKDRNGWYPTEKLNNFIISNGYPDFYKEDIC